MLIQVSLRAVHKEICKKGRDADLTEISFKGQFKNLSHTYIGLPQGFNFNFPTSSPSLLYGSPSADYPQHRHINSDDFVGHLVLRIEDY